MRGVETEWQRLGDVARGTKMGLRGLNNKFFVYFFRHFCTASIISPRALLTAAHCIGINTSPPNNFTAVVGINGKYNFTAVVGINSKYNLLQLLVSMVNNYILILVILNSYINICMISSIENRHYQSGLSFPSKCVHHFLHNPRPLTKSF